MQPPCKKRAPQRPLTEHEWFVESWDSPIATVQTQEKIGSTDDSQTIMKIYKVRCKASYLMLNHDPDIPKTPVSLWQKERPCGELISSYVGKIITKSVGPFWIVEVIEGVPYEHLSLKPDADGWVTDLSWDDQHNLELQKNVPPKTDELGHILVADEAHHWVPDITKHKGWYREVYSVVSQRIVQPKRFRD
jgi:hypothetical protein